MLLAIIGKGLDSAGPAVVLDRSLRSARDTLVQRVYNALKGRSVEERMVGVSILKESFQKIIAIGA